MDKEKKKRMMVMEQVRYETAKAVFQVFDHMYREGRHESEIRQELVLFVENLKPKQETIH
ncbi:MAG: hypothetical protein GY908_08550 [Flavobacteriales bacterium]|nr:hypothetical protein [Flavobacteriales bacterium]